MFDMKNMDLLKPLSVTLLGACVALMTLQSGVDPSSGKITTQKLPARLSLEANRALMLIPERN
jgi:hypothetical protein